MKSFNTGADMSIEFRVSAADGLEDSGTPSISAMHNPTALTDLRTNGSPPKFLPGTLPSFLTQFSNRKKL
jgi:hypothetical protein